MVIFFSIYAFLGYIMESVYVSILQKKWISSGLLKGPFIPLYGIGAITLILLSPYLTQPWLCFFIGGITMTCIEYISSLYIEKVFHTKCWDYSHHHFQFQGRICLFYYLIWSFLSCLFIFYIHPWIIKIIPCNDITLLFSLIFITFISKSFIDQINHSKNNELISKKEYQIKKESHLS